MMGGLAAVSGVPREISKKCLRKEKSPPNGERKRDGCRGIRAVRENIPLAIALQAGAALREETEPSRFVKQNARLFPKGRP